MKLTNFQANKAALLSQQTLKKSSKKNTEKTNTEAKKSSEAAGKTNKKSFYVFDQDQDALANYAKASIGVNKKSDDAKTKGGLSARDGKLEKRAEEASKQREVENKKNENGDYKSKETIKNPDGTVSTKYTFDDGSTIKETEYYNVKSGKGAEIKNKFDKALKDIEENREELNRVLKSTEMVINETGIETTFKVFE